MFRGIRCFSCSLIMHSPVMSEVLQRAAAVVQVLGLYCLGMVPLPLCSRESSQTCPPSHATCP